MPEYGADDLLVALTEHPSTKVLCSLTKRHDLPFEALMKLVKTDNLTLRRELLDCAPFQAWANTDLLIDWSKSDEGFARIVAESINHFPSADIKVLFEALITHPDPDVRQGLANTCGLPEQFYERLRQDTEIGVAWAAEKAIYNER